MNNLYTYIIIFALLLLGASIALITLRKKYRNKKTEFKPKLILFSLLSTILISIIGIIYYISANLTNQEITAPNDLLGISYVKAIRQNNYKII